MMKKVEIKQTDKELKDIEKLPEDILEKVVDIIFSEVEIE